MNEKMVIYVVVTGYGGVFIGEKVVYHRDGNSISLKGVAAIEDGSTVKCPEPDYFGSNEIRFNSPVALGEASSKLRSAYIAWTAKPRGT